MRKSRADNLKTSPLAITRFFYIATFNDDRDLQSMTITINSADSFLLKFLMFSLLLRVIMLYLFRASRYFAMNDIKGNSCKQSWIAFVAG